MSTKVENMDAVPDMQFAITGNSKDGFVGSVTEVKRPTLSLFKTPQKKTKAVVKAMCEKWIKARTKQLIAIDALKRERQATIAEDLAKIYREIDVLEEEKKSISATIKGKEGKLRELVKNATRPEVALEFSFVDKEAAGDKAASDKPAAAHAGGKSKKATKKKAKAPKKATKKKVARG